jgi:UDP-N-acetyl-D-mannosaminuronate dehydrogenase
VDDLRESPAIEVAKLLAESGARVRAYEPYKLEANIPGIDSAPSLGQTIEDAEIILLLVGHKEFRELDPKKMRALTPATMVVDTINGWDERAWTRAGFKVCRLGVGKSNLDRKREAS